MPISRANSRASSSSPVGQAGAGAGDGHGRIAQGQLRRLGDHGAVDAAGKRDGARAVAADQFDELSRFALRSDMALLKAVATRALRAGALVNFDRSTLGNEPQAGRCGGGPRVPGLKTAPTSWSPSRQAACDGEPARPVHRFDRVARASFSGYLQGENFCGIFADWPLALAVRPRGTACRSGQRSTCAAASACASSRGTIARETVFGDDPAAMARHWVDQGAEYLHLVDLDGATQRPRRELGQHRGASSRPSSVPCELGGGIRDEATIARLLDLGLRARGDRHAGGQAARLVSPDVPASFPTGWRWGSTRAAAWWPPRAGWKRAACRPSSWRGNLPTSRWRRSSTPTSTPTACWPARTWRRWPKCRGGRSAGRSPRAASPPPTTSRRLAALGAGRLHHRPGTVRGNLSLSRRAGRSALHEHLS